MLQISDGRRPHNGNANLMEIVVSTLLSLMGTQIQSLRELNFKAVAVNDIDFDIMKCKDLKNLRKLPYISKSVSLKFSLKNP